MFRLRIFKNCTLPLSRPKRVLLREWPSSGEQRAALFRSIFALRRYTVHHFITPTASTQVPPCIPNMSTIRSEGSSPKSLLEYLDLSQLNCLNEVERHNIKGLLSGKTRNTTDSYLLSDADEQLLLNIYFNQAVRIKSVVLHTANAQEGPKLIWLLVNRPAINFDDVGEAGGTEVAQVLEVSEDDVKEGRPIELRFVRFQSVNSLHIFVSSNHGEEEATRIDAIDILGFPVGVTKDLSELKKGQDD